MSGAGAPAAIPAQPPASRFADESLKDAMNRMRDTAKWLIVLPSARSSTAFILAGIGLANLSEVSDSQLPPVLGANHRGDRAVLRRDRRRLEGDHRRRGHAHRPRRARGTPPGPARGDSTATPTCTPATRASMSLVSDLTAAAPPRCSAPATCFDHDGDEADRASDAEQTQGLSGRCGRSANDCC